MQLKPGNITKDDVTDLAFLVLTAGNAALTNSIGLVNEALTLLEDLHKLTNYNLQGTLSLLQHPEQADEIKKEPDVVAPDVVNEILRYHTVSAVNGRRVAIEDFKLGGMVCKPSAMKKQSYLILHQVLHTRKTYAPKICFLSLTTSSPLSSGNQKRVRHNLLRPIRLT